MNNFYGFGKSLDEFKVAQGNYLCGIQRVNDVSQTGDKQFEKLNQRKILCNMYKQISYGD